MTNTAAISAMHAKLSHPLGGYFTCRPFRITSNGDGRLRLHFTSGEVQVIDARRLLDVEVSTGGDDNACTSAYESACENPGHDH